MPTTRKRPRVSFTDAELLDVKAKAATYRLSLSEFGRRLMLGHRLPSPEDFAGAELTGQVIASRADLARVGNLLKLTLDQAGDAFTDLERAKIAALVDEIRAKQRMIGDVALRIDAARHPRRPRG